MTGQNISLEAVYPNFGDRETPPAPEQTALMVPANSIRRLAEKIVRGLVYLQDGLFIEPPHAVEFYALTDEGAEPIMAMLDKYGETHSRGPGIVVKRAVAPEDGRTSFYSIVIFGRLKMYASVGHEG